VGQRSAIHQTQALVVACAGADPHYGRCAEPRVIAPSWKAAVGSPRTAATRPSAEGLTGAGELDELSQPIVKVRLDIAIRSNELWVMAIPSHSLPAFLP
jgi:hypothetical protein